jgi:hypothetical protein
MSAALQLSLWDVRAADDQPSPVRRVSAHLRRIAEFDRGYSGWRAAVPEASAGLFSLNRFCKHDACSWQYREEIYELKNRFVQLLYQAGYCTAAWEHRMVLAAKVCRACGGTGDDGLCDRCDVRASTCPRRRSGSSASSSPLAQSGTPGTSRWNW